MGGEGAVGDSVNNRLDLFTLELLPFHEGYYGGRKRRMWDMTGDQSFV